MISLPSMRSMSLLQLANLGSAYTIFISLNGRVAAFDHPAHPGEKLGGSTCR
jgi:hypothetical protein